MNKLITIKYDKNSGKFIWVFGIVRGKKIRVPEHHIPEPFIVKWLVYFKSILPSLIRLTIRNNCLYVLSLNLSTTSLGIIEPFGKSFVITINSFISSTVKTLLGLFLLYSFIERIC